MRKLKVLMVDDEVSLTRLTKINLEAEGSFEVQTVNQGRQALAAARAFRPDVILMDVMMPDISGGEAAEQIRRDPLVGKTPLIFLTAAVRKKEVNAAGGTIGGQLYVAKPVTATELANVLAKFSVDVQPEPPAN